MIKEIETYLAEFGEGKNNLSDKTARNYKASLILFSEYFQLNKLEDLDKIDEMKFREFVYSLNLKESTKNFHIRNIRAFVSYILRDKNLSQKIFNQGITSAKFGGKGRLVKEGKREVVSLTDEEILKIIDATDDQFRMMLRFMLNTGLRAHEVCKLKVSDFDLSTGKFFVRGKGDKPAVLAVPQKVFDEFLIYLKNCHNGGEYVFYPTRGRGKRNLQLSPNSVNVRLKSAINSTDIPEERKKKITSHILRKTLITRIAKQNIILAQKVARHSSIAITAKYYVDDSDMAVETLQNFEAI